MNARPSLVLVVLALAAGSPGLEAADVERPVRSYVHGRSAVPRAVAAHLPIPAFARLYGTGCSTCHSAAPKLNVLGEVFRLAGYRLPDNDVLLRRDEPVALGAPPWRDQWPRAIWPSDLPGTTPLALRVQMDMYALNDGNGGRDFDMRLPHEVYLLAGAPLGDEVSAFLEVEWNPDDRLRILQAKVGFQNPIPGLPDGAASLWIGRQDAHLLTFTDRQIDRAGLLPFSWQFFRLSELRLTDAAAAEVTATNALMLGAPLPTVELNGVLGGRLHYGVGVSQGGGGATADNNDELDAYYRLRYKWGGLDLRGQYDPGGGPVLGTGGQLQDRALIVEHFGYRGNESTATSPQGGHRATGVSARALFEAWDVGVGWVKRTFEQPLGTPEGDFRGANWFAKVDFLALPWLLATLKYDHFDVDTDPAAVPAGLTLQPANRRRLVPGAALLLRQNIRAVVEGRVFLEGDAVGMGPTDPTSELFLRLDVIF